LVAGCFFLLVWLWCYVCFICVVYVVSPFAGWWSVAFKFRIIGNIKGSIKRHARISFHGYYKLTVVVRMNIW
jgi:hypothetical protein